MNTHTIKTLFIDTGKADLEKVVLTLSGSMDDIHKNIKAQLSKMGYHTHALYRLNGKLYVTEPIYTGRSLSKCFSAEVAYHPYSEDID